MDSKNNHSRHTILMALCCVIPLGLLFVAKFFGLKQAGYFLIVLLCPLLHFVMMSGMGTKEKKHQHSGGKMTEDRSQRTEDR